MNRYLEKISEDTSHRKAKVVASLSTGAAGIGAGVASLRKTLPVDFHRGNLTGRETLYHGSSRKYIPNILRKGILPNRTGHTVSRRAGLAEANKDRIFLSKNIFHADSYGRGQEDLDRLHIVESGNKSVRRHAKKLGVKPPLEDINYILHRFNKDYGALSETRLNNVISANIPTWKKEYKNTLNPEVKGLIKKFRDGKKAQGVSTKLDSKIKGILSDSYPDMHVIHNPKGLSPKYLKGSPRYKSNSFKEIGEFIKHNPTRFSKALGRTLGGIGLVGAGMYGIKKGLGKINE